MDVWIKPNWHAVMIHLPIGLLVAGVVWELLGVFFRSSVSARGAGRWMVLVGAVLGIPTALSGVYAYKDLFPEGLQSVEDAGLKEVLKDHILLQSVAAGAALVLTVFWVALSDVWRRRLHWPLVGLLTLMLATTLVGAHHGGQLVYKYRVGVESETLSTRSTDSPPSLPPTEPGLSGKAKALAAKAAVGAPPVQTHVVVAGFALALAAVSLGLAARAVAQRDDIEALAQEASAQRIAAAFSPGVGAAANAPYDLDDYGRAVPAPARRGVPRRDPYVAPAVLIPTGVMPPAGRFWLLAALCLTTAALTGWWTLASELETWNVQALWQAITDRDLNAGRIITRRYAHLVTGSALVVLSLILALLARFGKRQKFLLSFFGLLLVLAIVAQAWLGVLLLLEDAQGPVTEWQEVA